MISVDRLDFDSNFEVGSGVDGLIDFSESPLIDFANNFEVLADFLQHLRHSCLNKITLS